VTLIYHIHFVPTLHRGKLSFFDQLSDIIHSRVTSGINFDHIQGITGGNAFANLTLAAGFLGGLFLLQAVEGFGQNASARSFACASGARKQVSRGNPFGTDGIDQGLGDRLLPYQVGKGLRAIFVVERFVAHRACGRKESEKIKCIVWAMIDAPAILRELEYRIL
jgi:hypothetical protein